MTKPKTVISLPGDGSGPPDMMSVAQALNVAMRLHQLGQLAEAESIYRGVLESVPAQPDACHFLGVLRHQLAHSEEAITLIQRAVTLSPGYADAHSNLGNVFKQLGRFSEAERCYRRAIGLQPGHADAHNNLGVVLKVLGRTEEAWRAYRCAIEHNPKHADAHHNLGNVLKRQGQLNEALKHFRQAIALNPAHTAARNSLGLALQAAGKDAEAAASFRDWVACDPENPTARHLLAASTGQDVPDRAADAYVEDMFDHLADSFDEHLHELEYRAPELIATAVRDVLPAPAQALDVLDAGCGTGLCAAFLGPYARHLCGVDLSGGMLARAERLKLYDVLIKAELTGFLLDHPGSYDLIVSADTLCYFGDLRDVLGAAQRSLRPSGLLLFTVEWLAREATGFRLEPHGRYSHTEAYLREVLLAARLETVGFNQTVLRRESGKPVAGMVVTARKAGSTV